MNKKQKILIFLIAVSTILFTSTTAIGNNVSNNLRIQNTGGFSISPSDVLEMVSRDGSTLSNAPAFYLSLWSYDSRDYVDYTIKIEGESSCNWGIKDNEYSGHLEVDEYLNPDSENHFPVVSNVPKIKNNKVYGKITVSASGILNGREFQDTLSIDIEVEENGPISRGFIDSQFLSMLHGQFPRLATLFDFLSMLHR